MIGGAWNSYFVFLCSGGRYGGSIEARTKKHQHTYREVRMVLVHNSERLRWWARLSLRKCKTFQLYTLRISLYNRHLNSFSTWRAWAITHRTLTAVNRYRPAWTVIRTTIIVSVSGWLKRQLKRRLGYPVNVVLPSLMQDSCRCRVVFLITQPVLVHSRQMALVASIRKARNHRLSTFPKRNQCATIILWIFSEPNPTTLAFCIRSCRLVEAGWTRHTHYFNYFCSM